MQPSINDKLKAPCGQDNYCNYNSGCHAVFTTSNRSFGVLATPFLTLLDRRGGAEFGDSLLISAEPGMPRF